MRTYAAPELLTFLEAIDRHLSAPEVVVLIGGAAASLAYGFDRATLDLDTWTSGSTAFSNAVNHARIETGLRIPVHHAAVADAPYSFEDRLLTLDAPQLRLLTILVPERHDLVLMKLVRGYEHDIEAAVAIHDRHGLTFETLLDRYRTEMTHVVGDPRRLDLNFTVAVERLFGPHAADRVERTLRAARGESA